jgi:hypothetical protein
VAAHQLQRLRAAARQDDVAHEAGMRAASVGRAAQRMASVAKRT